MCYQSTIRAVLSGVLLAQAACSGSGEPSESDIHAAFQASLDQVYQQTVAMAGQEAADKNRTELHEVKKIACRPAEGSSAFDCDVQVEMTTTFGEQSTASTVRIIHSDDGWIVLQ